MCIYIILAMIQNSAYKSPDYKFVCSKCDYKTSYKKDYNRHLNTQKHKKIQEDTPKQYKCICGKEYKYHSGYYRHRKMCNINENVVEEKKEEIDYKSLIFSLINENKTLQDLLIKQQEDFINYQKEQQKEHNKELKNLILHIKPNHTITNNKTINNNNFNIMMFLNDKCKNAMTIQEFAERLVITIDDLEKKKFDCLTNTILKNLKSLSITERPVHCGNIKRKEWYLNDKDNGWELDNGEKLIKNTEYGINKKYQNEFKKHYPNYSTEDHIQDKYMNLIHKTLTDLPENEKSRLLNILAKDLMIDSESI
jgi:hypothetical protein